MIIIGRSPGRRVAAEFSHEDFPRARFGHRFESEPSGGHRQTARLIEQLEADVLHQIMDNPPLPDRAGIIWTAWGNPNSDPELEQQRADVEDASHQEFPRARFGHRFLLEPFAEGHEMIWLMEEIDTGALHRMMRNQPAADDAGIIWTTWETPAPV